jgi:hypothetical protein
MPEIEEFLAGEVTDTGEVEQAEEVKKFIDELGLKAQAKFFNTGGEVKTTFPYRRMTAQEQAVYSILCSQVDKIDEYGDSVIPLRVLQIASHAISLGFFKKLCVWHPENGGNSDPVLVGVHEDKEHWNREELYILARWGDILEPMNVLVEKAKKKGIELLKSKYTEIKNKVEHKLDSVEAIVTSYVEGNGGNMNPSYYD